MGPIQFIKMSGSGNDFIVVDNRVDAIAEADVAAFARFACRRRHAVGADGVVLIADPASDDVEADVRWRYINADGSDGEMCGNGAMCGARFAAAAGITGSAPGELTLRTPAGLVRATIAGNPCIDPLVSIAIDDPSRVEAVRRLMIHDLPVDLYRIVVGVPHAVLFVEDADAFRPGNALDAFGRAVRNHPAFAPSGVNLDIVAMRADGSIRMRTYERGVEAETLACGTGAIASAVVAATVGLASSESPVTVWTSGGRPLTVAFNLAGSLASGVTLRGEARFVARGEILPDAFA